MSGRAQRTLEAYRSDLDLFAGWYHETNDEPFDLHRLAIMDVLDYVEWAQKKYTPATVNRRLLVIKRYAEWAAQQGMLDPELAARIKKIPIVRKQELAPRALTDREARRLLKEVQARGSARDEAIITLMLYTGLRIGEVSELRVGDVEMSERKGVVTIRAEVAKAGRERVAPIPKRAREALIRYLDERKAGGGEMLFTGRQGPLSTAGLGAIIRRYGAWAHLDDLTPHVLRHTFAYNYLANNANDLIALADILGHTDLNTTRIYTKRRLSDLQNGAEQVRFYS